MPPERPVPAHRAVVRPLGSDSRVVGGEPHVGLPGFAVEEAVLLLDAGSGFLAFVLFVKEAELLSPVVLVGLGFRVPALAKNQEGFELFSEGVVVDFDGFEENVAGFGFLVAGGRAVERSDGYITWRLHWFVQDPRFASDVPANVLSYVLDNSVLFHLYSGNLFIIYGCAFKFDNY